MQNIKRCCIVLVPPHHQPPSQHPEIFVDSLDPMYIKDVQLMLLQHHPPLH
jgi:hypothetical protein